MASAPINVGIVGYGYAGGVLHPALISMVEGLRLHAVATRDEARRASAAALRGVKTFATLTEMLNDPSIEVIVVATPHDTHEELVVEALQAGRHVVCEKVMTLSLASADRMLQAAERSGRLLTVFQNRRWDGDFLTLRRAVESGLLGTLRFGEIAIHTHKIPRTWRNDVERSGGLLFDWGAHLVDQALRLFAGQVVGVAGFSQCWGAPGANAREALVRCQLRFSTGQVCSIEVSYASRLGRAHWFLIGDKGTLTKDGLDPQEAMIRSGQPGKPTEDPSARARVRAELNGIELDISLDTIPGSWATFYENLRDAVRGRAPLSVVAREARDVVAVLEAHTRAARERREVLL